MDIATGLGLLGGIGSIVAIIIIDGGNFGAFIDKHAAIIIFGGTGAATMMRFSFGAMAHGIPLGLRSVFSLRKTHPRDFIEQLTQIADLVRKNGPMALENVQADEPFLAQGLRYIADGYDKDFIRETMEKDRDNFLMRMTEAGKIYRAIGDAAPAWGMIGTILGMVTMFSNMSDPSKLGPAMAVALLATLYGALIANMITLPIADKLHMNMEEEDIIRSLIIDGVLQIRENKSPAVIKEMLLAYLPDHHRAEFADA